jgi:hypothetical protein
MSWATKQTAALIFSSPVVVVYRSNRFSHRPRMGMGEADENDFPP